MLSESVADMNAPVAYTEYNQADSGLAEPHADESVSTGTISAKQTNDYDDSSPSIHDAGTVPMPNSPLIDQLSKPIVGQWNVLVSQTNWEKGSLILHWRNELIAAGFPNTVYSDEAWARHVNNVSAQHVGRLRRVSERFGNTHQNFSGLFWSHFSVALDWEDAELWLEGAVQNSWSVAQMRVQRWDAIGVVGEQKPQDSDVFAADFGTTDFEEDTCQQPLADRIEGRHATIVSANVVGSGGVVEAGAVEGFDASSVAVPEGIDKPAKKKGQTKKDKTKHSSSDGLRDTMMKTGEVLMSLKEISAYPVDLAEPMELLKVAILNHKLAGWPSVSADQIRRSLDALRMLAVAED